MSIKEQLLLWSKTPMSINPYGNPLPDKYLNSTVMLKPHLRNGKPFGEYLQDGYITEIVLNDKNKTTPWEVDNYVIFSEIRERLYKNNTLCISNYLVEVLLALDKVEQEKNKSFSDEYRIGTMCRSLRTFASFIRECDLKEMLEDAMGHISRITKKHYVFPDVTAQMDSKEKTDILLHYDDKVFRIWSYQVTPAGVNKTSHRIIDDYGRPRLNSKNNSGYNLLMPFDMYGNKEVYLGWFLYDKREVNHILINKVALMGGVLTCEEVYEMIRRDRNAVKQSVSFFV